MMAISSMLPDAQTQAEHGIRAFANIVARCLGARSLAGAWDRAAAHIALTSLNAGLASRRSTHGQAVFAALARETREITGAIRALVAEGLPLARTLARRSSEVITATRDLEGLKLAHARITKYPRVAQAVAMVENKIRRAKEGMVPDLMRLGAIFRDLEWNLVRLRTVARYFRIEASRDPDGGAGFLVASTALVDKVQPLENRGADLAATFQSIVVQLGSGGASVQHAQ